MDEAEKDEEYKKYKKGQNPGEGEYVWSFGKPAQPVQQYEVDLIKDWDDAELLYFKGFYRWHQEGYRAGATHFGSRKDVIEKEIRKRKKAGTFDEEKAKKELDKKIMLAGKGVESIEELLQKQADAKQGQTPKEEEIEYEQVGAKNYKKDEAKKPTIIITGDMPPDRP